MASRVLASPSASAPAVEPTVVRAALDRLEGGDPVTPEDAAVLFSARGGELDQLTAIASRLRDEGLEHAGRPGVITYSKKVFLPITHLCRDRCHYCIFVETPGKLARTGKAPFLSPERILEVAEQGAALGCKEALFTLGDRPEDRWPIARAWLDEHGYASTLDYVRDMAVLVLERTGLLPHLNPGVMTWAEMQRLKPVAPSMGMMLETTSRQLWAERGGVHFGSPDKDPELRLRVLEDAGRSRIPFTTGVLLGIGEDDAERADALFSIRAAHERHGHVQETIVQNFRAKPGTAMQNESDLALQEYVAAVAVARVVLGSSARVQAPPNLTDARELRMLVRAGIDDWGGVSPLTPDHVNPERPWPQLDELARLTAEAGFELRERLTAHPHYVREGEPWIDRRVLPAVHALADASGLADEAAPVLGRPLGGVPRFAPPAVLGGEVAAILRKAERDPAGLADHEYAALLEADGAALDALAALADDVRRSTLGETATFVVNRNIDSSLLSAEARPPVPGRRGTLTVGAAGDLADEAADLGATEVCIQGAVPRELPATAYLDLVREVKRRRPGLHVHAYRPVEVADAAARLGVTRRELLLALREAGVDTVPGTGARVLDDGIRSVLSGGTELSVAEWVEHIVTAHELGLRSTATLVYGSLETSVQQVAHLRTLARIQDRTAGFTEFIAMPFLPAEAPAAVRALARPGPSVRESRALHAVARLLLSGRIDHVQVAWTKLGLGVATLLLRGGADDLGGALLDGRRRPDAGPESGLELTVDDFERLAHELGREPRQRTTTYEPVPEERTRAARLAGRSAPPPGGSVRRELPLAVAG